MSGTSAVHPSATTMVCLYSRKSVPRTSPAAATVFAYVGPLMCRISPWRMLLQAVQPAEAGHGSCGSQVVM